MKHAICKILAAALLALAVFQAAAAEITVSAASSLTNAMREIARRFEAQQGGARVLLNFGASGALQQQIANGAPVDVLATADEQTMDEAARLGLIAGERRVFARNALVLVVPAGHGSDIGSLNDLIRLRRIAIGNPDSVPAGRYAQRALEAAGLWSWLLPRLIPAQNVRQALDYVARGEVDAGFVYASDAAAMPQRVAVALTLQQPVRYPVARTAASANAGDAQRFIDFLLSDAAQAVLVRHGLLRR